MQKQQSRIDSSFPTRESGQAMVFVMLALGIFLIAASALAVDFTYLWFHRQAAQTAADAACVAGAMDMLAKVNNVTFTSSGFTPGTAFDCLTTTNGPCSYANLNSYTSTLSRATATTAGTTAGVNVYGSFPVCAGETGCSVSCPAGSTCPAQGVTPAPGVTNPFFKVEVVDRVKVFFLGMLNFSRTMDVKATATCGLIQADSAASIVLLHPTSTASLDMNNNSTLIVAGGSFQSIRVNSTSTTAVSAGSAIINTVYGGAEYCGGSGLVSGGPTAAPAGFATTGWPAGYGTAPTCTGTVRTPFWNAPATPSPDPFATVPAPDPATLPNAAAPATVAAGVNGCPLSSGTCKHYFYGKYPSGIDVKNETAVFEPGIYYVTGGFALGPNSCVRPTVGVNGQTVGGTSVGGTMFYFADGNGIAAGSNSGRCDSLGASTYALSSEKCTGTSSTGFLPSTHTVGGSVLAGPCLWDSTFPYGDPLGALNPIGMQRGLLLFHNRAAAGTASFGGGGELLLAGHMYMHQCTTGGGADPGINAACVSGAYGSLFDFRGGSGATTFVLGSVITDKMSFGGNTSLAMLLSPIASYKTYKASLFR